ncbi:hypothetical protein KGF57_003678 [Candida theae]|uniref:Major facilitator superfamily (MFS) profile domain-containing protein n=1 Tax=Candida theae TaxID=1198502 RepID=A0AAD5BCQ6_9ASCO|nr:uncharacterized protein KGF57_003678 [Candida theae]KAI5955545.1 hypothetical protein KGF57_003678 [Candida theae]
MDAKQKNYTVANYAAFNYAGFACVALIVFLTSTQPFYIKEVIGIEPKPGKDTKIGRIVGGLGFFDEVVSMSAAPLLGALNDRLSAQGYAGAKLIQSVSFIIIALALLGYALNHNLVPMMFILRGVFALGVTGCMSMVTVMLNQLSMSDFKFAKLWRKQRSQGRNLGNDTVARSRNGKFAAVMGIATGLGAIFSVSTLVTLPSRLAEWSDLKSGLEGSYVVVSVFALISFAILFGFLYRPQEKAEDIHHRRQFIKEGIEFARDSKEAQIAFVGAFVARSTTVATTLYIPLVVYNWYYNIGGCKSKDNWAGKLTCYDGYIFSAILTGVAQTVALASAPIWGYLSDSNRVGKFRSLAIAGLCGVLGNFGLSLSATMENYSPKTAWCFVSVSIIGLSQIGLIICSMSLLSGIENAQQVMGSLSGLYTFAGGLGIMIITLVGGLVADAWIVAPFFILGSFNVVLLVVCSRFDKPKITIEEEERLVMP